VCKGISAVALEREFHGRRVVFKCGVNSHSDIRSILGISDTVAGEQVNLEALPGPGRDFADYVNWSIRVDHNGTPPKWFVKDKELVFSQFRDFFEGEIKEVLSTKKYDGSLDLSDTQIASLPEGLTVGGYLDLRDTQITLESTPKHLHGKLIF
jgi:hypothetical protein